MLLLPDLTASKGGARPQEVVQNDIECHSNAAIGDRDVAFPVADFFEADEDFNYPVWLASEWAWPGFGRLIIFYLKACIHGILHELPNTNFWPFSV